MKRSPYCELTVLACGYLRATVTATLGGNSTTWRGARVLDATAAVAMIGITSDRQAPVSLSVSSSGRGEIESLRLRPVRRRRFAVLPPFRSSSKCATLCCHWRFARRERLSARGTPHTPGSQPASTEESGASPSPMGFATAFPRVRIRARTPDSNAAVCLCHPELRPDDLHKMFVHIRRSGIDHSRGTAFCRRWCRHKGGLRGRRSRCPRRTRPEDARKACRFAPVENSPLPPVEISPSAERL